MKRINVLMLGTIVLASSLLSSCGSLGNENIDSKLDEIILNNLNEEKVKDDSIEIYKKTSISKSDLEENSSLPYFGQYGVYLQKDYYRIKFNSLIYPNYLNNKTFNLNFISDVSISRDPLIGDLVEIKFGNGNYTVYEQHGYIIYEGLDKPTISASKMRINDIERVVIKVSSTISETAYFYFEDNGKKVSVYDFNEQVNPEEVIFGIKKGDEIGLKEHYYSINQNGSNDSYNVVSIYDKSFKGISTFSIPNDINFSGVVNNKFFYQEYKVHNVDYKNEYTLESYVVDVLTGDTKSVKLNYLIEGNLNAFKDETGNYTLGVVNAKKILLDNSIASRESTLLINGKGEVVKDLSGVEPLSFIKASENTIFNTATNILYNNDLTPVVSLGTKFNYIPSIGYIIGQNEGKYGAYDLSLNQCVSFEYDYISENTLNGNLIGIKSGQLYLISAHSTKVVDLYDESITKVTLLESGVFVASTSDNEKYIIGNNGNTFKLIEEAPVLSIPKNGKNESYYVYKVENLIDSTLNDYVTIKKVTKE